MEPGAAPEVSGEPEAGGPSRLDRELDELLQELRVLLPGTTVLLGFLLALSFSRTFAEAPGPQRALFIVAFLTTAVSAVLLITPGVRHRTRFRDRDKEALVRSGNRIAIAASVLLAASLTAVTALVVEHVYGWAEALIAGGGLLALAGWFWWGWAVMRDLSRDREEGSRRPGPSPAGIRAEGGPTGTAR